LDATPQDLNAMIRRSLLLVKHELTGNHIEATAELDSSIPQVLLDPNKIQQVFVNLFMNAIQSMHSGGALTVRTYVRPAEPAEADDSSSSMVVAEVDDTGAGIPPEKLSKVFEPFFTTKAVGRGTGLGLTVVQKIVDLHDGTVAIHNHYKNPADISACTGARVTVTLKAYGSETHDRDEQRSNIQTNSNC
jgi:two-component system sensor histidine kinase HydH